MATKILIDINICIDVLTYRKPFFKEAAHILQASENGEINAYISAISFDTIYYIMRPAQSRAQATGKLKKLTSITSVGTVNGSIIKDALNTGWNDLEDAIQYYTAVHNYCEAVVSRNTKDFKPNRIPVLSPGEFIASYL